MTSRRLPALALVPFLLAADKREAAPTPRPTVDITGYTPLKDAKAADPKQFKLDAVAPAALGYLGVQIAADSTGRPVIDDVDADSPAEAAGLKAGDVIEKIAELPVNSAASARDALRGRAAGEAVPIAVRRELQTIAVTATLKAVSKPFKTTSERAVLGLQVERAKQGSGAAVTSVTTGGGAERAGVKVGDVLVKLNATPVESDGTFRDAMADKKPGEQVMLTLLRGKETLEVKATAGGEESGRGRFGGGGWDDRLPRAWTKPSYKLAILGVEYPDQKHNPKITDADWEASMFSDGTYTRKSSTGQDVYGSMADYYKEISYGKFKVEGKFVGWVEVSKKRMEYSTGSGTSGNEKVKYPSLSTPGRDPQ